jgi:hypothetical protein
VELKMPKLREKNHKARINVGEISEMEAGIAESAREAGRRQQQREWRVLPKDRNYSEKFVLLGVEPGIDGEVKRGGELVLV